MHHYRTVHMWYEKGRGGINSSTKRGAVNIKTEHKVLKSSNINAVLQNSKPYDPKNSILDIKSLLFSPRKVLLKHM